MASTRADEPPARSGIDLPLGVNRSREWIWFRENRRRHLPFRAGVFAVGLVLIAVGAALWLISALLCMPAVSLGLWVWSREFHWGHRLFTGFLKRAQSLWLRAKAQPARWALITIGGVAAAWAGYWAVGHFRLLGIG